MRFLDLAQAVASESGTVPGAGLPLNTSGQTGRLSKIVEYTNSAWRDIQSSRRDWLFMRGFVSGPALAGNRYLEGSDVGITSRWGQWVVLTREGLDSGLTLYQNDLGLSQEGVLIFQNWPIFRRNYLRGEQGTGIPQVVSVAPDRRLALAPIPAEDCTITGEYRKAPQELVNDDDQPELPEEFHALIKYGALLKLANHDESVQQQGHWVNEYSILKQQLVNDQTPAIRRGGTLA